jgi:hypothetical protein
MTDERAPKDNVEQALLTTIDTVDGIKRYLEHGLEGFHELIWVRRKYQDSNPLRSFHKFIVHGKWALDDSGMTGRVRVRLFNPGPIDQAERFSMSPIAEVIPLDALRAIFPAMLLEIIFDAAIPKPSDICQVCKRGWTLANAHDVELIDRSGVDRALAHGRCLRLHQRFRDRDYFANILKEAGFDLGKRTCCGSGRSRRRHPRKARRAQEATPAQEGRHLLRPARP